MSKVPAELDAAMTPAVRAFVVSLLARIKQLEARIEQLEARIKKLLARIEQLEARLEMTPENSSLPPLEPASASASACQAGTENARENPMQAGRAAAAQEA